jgi:Tol biopolymer transport system component
LSWSSGAYSAAGVRLAAAVIAAIGLAAESVAEFVPAEDLPPEPKPAAIEPLDVRPLMGVESGRNDSNPVWSPSGTLLAFERSRGDRKEIVIARPDGAVVHSIYFQLSDTSKEPKFFFPGVVEDVSYNAGITWSPAGDRLVFMSNGGAGNYDLYLRELDGKTTRLTDHKEKDGHADWSPAAQQLVFVSGRTGKGDIYLLDVATRAVTRLTWGDKPYLYPRWSPDGKKIAMIHGSTENHDIYLIEDVRKPGETLRALTMWTADDLRPMWSPDGRKIAFYSNFNPTGDPRMWAILVVAADGSDPIQGEGLAAKIVATDVVPDVERGPAWMPDSNRIAYVRNAREDYNPVYIADLVRKTNLPLKTETKMNHDVACSPDGRLAFRAQVNQWDQIFLARLKD